MAGKALSSDVGKQDMRTFDVQNQSESVDGRDGTAICKLQIVYSRDEGAGGNCKVQVRLCPQAGIRDLETNAADGSDHLASGTTGGDAGATVARGWRAEQALLLQEQNAAVDQ